MLRADDGRRLPASRMARRTSFPSWSVPPVATHRPNSTWTRVVVKDVPDIMPVLVGEAYG